MVKVLFVCTGNICRSPTAHGVLRDKARAAGLDIVVDSAGTHAHVDCAPDRRSQSAAKARGYDLSGLRARQVRHDDFENFDMILCMDQGHVLTLQKFVPAQFHGKIRLFDERDVGDPYYGSGDGFERVLDQIEVAADRLLDALKSSPK